MPRRGSASPPPRTPPRAAAPPPPAPAPAPAPAAAHPPPAAHPPAPVAAPPTAVAPAAPAQPGLMAQVTAKEISRFLAVLLDFISKRFLQFHSNYFKQISIFIKRFCLCVTLLFVP